MFRYIDWSSLDLTMSLDFLLFSDVLTNEVPIPLIIIKERATDLFTNL